MSESTYNWKRFWCRPNGRANLDYDGYLYDPDSDLGAIFNPGVVAFDKIRNLNCVVLLGEAGAGKSRSLRSIVESERLVLKAQDRPPLLMDLGYHGDENVLVRELFECGDFSDWRHGSGTFHLFLDSFDECQDRIQYLYKVLLRELQRIPEEKISNLFVRIACRTGRWPKSFELGLGQLWRNEVVAAFELAPLRRVDVCEAARVHEIDPDGFLKDIHHAGAVPLAIRPVTLDFLLEIYSQTGELPGDRISLYLDGCRRLCREPRHRRDAEAASRFTPGRRLSIAERIAAMTLFGNRAAIIIGQEPNDILQSDLPIEQICDDTKATDLGEARVTEEDVRDCLQTGLFTSRGDFRFGWAHQTFAEFLGVKFCISSALDRRQVLGLLKTSSAEDSRVVPQLRAPAAWLANMSPYFLDHFVENDPEVLLQGEVGLATDSHRELVVNHLLRRAESDTGFDESSYSIDALEKLRFSGLADLVRPVLARSLVDTSPRRLAIKLSRSCLLTEFLNELAAIALDDGEPETIRVRAADAFSSTADDDDKPKLKPLLSISTKSDSQEELKGIALRLLWPDLISAKELFDALASPKRDHFFGVLDMFLAGDFLSHLSPFDLPVALRWVESLPPAHERSSTLGRPYGRIIALAWQHLQVLGVSDALASALLVRLRRYDFDFTDAESRRSNSDLFEDDICRRQLLDAIIPRLSDTGPDPVQLAHCIPALARSRDIEWLIERLERTDSVQEQTVVCDLIAYAFDGNDARQIDLLLVKSQEISVLGERLRPYFEAVRLDSPTAVQQREYLLRIHLMRTRAEEVERSKPKPNELIERYLANIEAGKIDQWWMLTLALATTPNDDLTDHNLQRDIRVLSLWEGLDVETRVRIVGAARKYVLTNSCDPDKWLGKDVYYWPAIAGFKAIRLLLREDPGFLLSLTVDCWRNWAAILVGYPTYGHTDDDQAHEELIAMAYGHSPEEVLRALQIAMISECDRYDQIYVVRLINRCWDKRLAEVCLTSVRTGALKSRCVETLFGVLLGHSDEQARSYAESLLRGFSSEAGGVRDAELAAAISLANHSSDACWSIIWPAVEANPGFGHSFIALLADRHEMHDGKIVGKLSEEALASLYSWLLRNYPPEEDPQHEGAYTVSLRDEIATFRTVVLQNLTRRGTPNARHLVARLVDEFPGYSWLRRWLENARETEAQTLWQPVLPDALLSLARRKNSRLVSNGTELMDAIIECLGRISEKLHGDTPEVQFLWEKGKPRLEVSLSDWTKIRLDEELLQKGIVVNREVEIHNTGRTDIRVDAVSRPGESGPLSRISALIEVKGCWNDELESAMETQLVGKYLRDSECRHGLYLIFWCYCDRFAPARHIHRQWWDTEFAKAAFDAQAEELSRGGLQIRSVVLDLRPGRGAQRAGSSPRDGTQQRKSRTSSTRRTRTAGRRLRAPRRRRVK